MAKTAEDTTATRFARVMRASDREVAGSMAVRALLRAQGRVMASMEEAVAPAGLTVPQFSVLVELAATPEGRLSLKEIGRGCMKSPPNITAIVDRLESAGLLRRSRDDADRRVVLAEITDAGWRALGAATPRMFAAQGRALDGLSDVDRGSLTELLEGVARES
jgi:DNA-binding MarR family transcriptional regulator